MAAIAARRRRRFQIAEELWDSAASDDLPVPASHKAIIRTRREAYQRGEMATLTLAQLKKAITSSSRNAR